MSRTVRVRHPLTDIPCQCSESGAREMRPRCGFSPKIPQLAAGMRIEPAPSEPVAAPTSPAATAAPLPPLEPPGVRPGSHGLRVAPRPRLGEAVDRELGEVDLADQDSTRGAQPGDDLRVRRRRAIEPARPEAGDVSGDIGHVLDRDWDAQKVRPLPCRAAAVGLVGFLERPLPPHDPERVEPRVEAGDSVQVQLDQLPRGHLSVRDHLRLAGDSRVRELRGVHSSAEPRRSNPQSRPNYAPRLVSRKPGTAQLYRRILATVRTHAGPLLVVAVVVFVPLSVLEALGDRALELDLEDLTAFEAGALSVAWLFQVASSLVGEVFYAGAVAALLVGERTGVERRLRDVARELPYVAPRIRRPPVQPRGGRVLHPADRSGRPLLHLLRARGAGGRDRGARNPGGLPAQPRAGARQRLDRARDPASR